MNKETIVVIRTLCGVALLLVLFYTVTEETSGEGVLPSTGWELPETGKNDKAYRPSSR